MFRLYPDSSLFFAVFWIAILAVGFSIMVVGFVETQHWIFALFGVACVWLIYDSMHGFYRWYRLPPAKLIVLDGDRVCWDSRTRCFAELTAIRFAIGYTKKRINFVPSGTDATGVMQLEFSDSEFELFRSGVGGIASTSGSGGAEDVKRMIKIAYAIGKAANIDPVRVGVKKLV